MWHGADLRIRGSRTGRRCDTGLLLANVHVAERASHAGFVTPFADAAIEGNAVEILGKRIHGEIVR